MAEPSPPAILAVADLERLHLRHLEQGGPGVAAAVRELAAERGVSVAEVVGAVSGAAGSPDPALAGWGAVVGPFVQTAIEAGALVVGQDRSHSTRSSGRGV